MLVLGQAPSGRRCLALSAPQFTHPNAPLFSLRKPKLISRNPRNPPLTLTVAANADGAADSAATTTKSTPPPPLSNYEETVFVGEESVPLEGVIQFDKPPSTSPITKWGSIGLLAGGDVLALFLFSAIGRFNHGFPVFDFETLRTADPFIAGWFLCAYFLGGYGEDGRGMNGLSKAVIAAARSWALGIPLGLIIRASTSGHIPPTNFILVTMGSTVVLLVGWRALLFTIFPNDKSKKNDVYRRGSPFELFELLTSLVRRW